MPWITNPFIERPELRPLIVTAVNGERKRLLNFQFLDALVETGQNASNMHRDSVRILARVALGQPNEVIAGRLSCSLSKVKMHISNMRSDFGVTNRWALFPAALTQKDIFRLSHPGRDDLFQIDENAMAVVNLLAQDNDYEEAGAILNIAKDTAMYRIRRASPSVGLNCAELMVTAACVTGKFDAGTFNEDLAA